MEDLKNEINLIDKEAHAEAFPPKRPKKRYRLLRFAAVFFALALFLFIGKAMISSESSDSWWKHIPIIGKHLANSAEDQLAGENNNRINILLLGMGGRNHEGGYLTDTIVLMSIDTEKNKIAIISIPRDLAIPTESRGWTKINNINAYAELEEKTDGGEALSQALGDVFHVQINYYTRVDFDGFINIIDAIDGVEIDVENTLEDYRYPIMGNENDPNFDARYEHLYIKEGRQTMDGSLALKYARSRHAYGIEGSDFARARRQQLLIQAVKDKLLSKSTLFQPRIITSIISELDKHVSTNLQTWEILKLWKISKDVPRENIITKVMDDGPNGLLVSDRNYIGQFILKPTSGDFEEIKYFIENIFDDATTEAKTPVISEKASVEIRNGTWINGLASQVGIDLEKYGFRITKIANSSEKNLKETIVYDLSYGEKMESLKILRDKTNARISLNLPDWLINDIENESKVNSSIEKPDFIIILGEDINNKTSL